MVEIVSETYPGTAVAGFQVTTMIVDDNLQNTYHLDIFDVGTRIKKTTLVFRNGRTRYMPAGLLTKTFSINGIRDDHTKTLIALNVDPVVLEGSGLLTIKAVDESGAASDETGANTYQVAGTVKIDTVVAARTVRVFDLSTGDQIAETVSDSSTGFFLVQWAADTANDVLVVATDNYGKKWTADTYYSAGDIVHPTNHSGYVYTAENAGTSGSTEPTWNTDSVTTDLEVTWSVAEFFRPVASGPITPEQIA